MPLALVRSLAIVASFIALLAWTNTASAYAWMIGHGYAKCATCHIDPSGGETLNHMGRISSEAPLSQDWGGTEPSSSVKAAYALDEPEWLYLGGSARLMSLLSFPTDTAEASTTTFPMQFDLYATAEWETLRAGASLGYADVPATSVHARPAQVLGDAGGPMLISRWHWLGYSPTSGTLLRAGRIHLPFGLRIPEHVAWVRDATRTDRESDQSHGLAFAGWGGRFRGEGMLIFGNLQLHPDSVRERGYSGYLESLLTPDLALGLSSMALWSKESILTGRTDPTLRQAHGLTLRYAVTDPLVVMLEADALHTTGRALGYTGLAVLDFEAARGLHLRGTGELLDAGRFRGRSELLTAGRATSGVWLSLHWFPLPHWDLQVDWVARYPDSRTLQAQLHFYL